MPLIIVSGYPCTGKTTFSTALSDSLRAADPNRNVVLINEESLHMNKQDYFSDAAREKLLRQNLKSAVDHVLNSETYVILDSLNYIKGYRYELYCIARSQRTPHCVVLVECDYETTKLWNAGRGDDCLDPTVMEDIRRRFERPNQANRWDKPLFIVNVTPDLGVSSHCAEVGEKVISSQPLEPLLVTSEPQETSPPVVFATSAWTSKKARNVSNSASSVVSGASLRPAEGGPKGVYFSGSLNSAGCSNDLVSTDSNNVDEIIRQIVTYFDTAEVPVPNAATMQVRHADAGLLYQLDRVSMTISQLVMSHQQNHSDGTPLVLTEYNSLVVALPRYVSLAEVQRLRRQFVKINSQHPPEDSIDISAKYVEFLMNQL